MSSYQVFEFVFQAKNQKTGEMREFRIVATSRMVALQKLEDKHPGWEFYY
jgi:hypothetical protein